MKNKGIVIFLIVLAVVIVAIITMDYLGDKPGKGGPNPFEYSVDNFKVVDSTMICYRETKNMKVDFEKPAAITFANGLLYVAGDRKIQVISPVGELQSEWNTEFIPSTIEVAGNKLLAASKNQIFEFDLSGKLLKEWATSDTGYFITAIASAPDFVYVADAGKRKIQRYSPDGVLLDAFDGKAQEGDIHGFIIPSPYFDMNINADGDLWVVNPGLHSLENYTPDGSLREHWNSTSMLTDGFSGCCNPAHFCFLPDGRFLTSEKGLVRIKIHKQSGEFDCVVAAPTKFKDEGEAPDIAVDSTGNVYALDFDKKMIRVFEKK